MRLMADLTDGRIGPTARQQWQLAYHRIEHLDLKYSRCRRSSEKKPASLKILLNLQKY